MTDHALLLVHAAATWLMTGLVLMVAVVHYPLMARVGADGFPGYARAHQARITLIVAPLMLVEAFAAVGLLIRASGATLPRVGLVLLLVCWGVTFLVNVPQHARLARGFDARTHRALLRWHWLRTLAWVARAGLALAMLAASASAPAA